MQLVREKNKHTRLKLSFYLKQSELNFGQFKTIYQDSGRSVNKYIYIYNNKR